MKNKDPIFAPREVFEQALEYFVIPTFDIVIEVPNRGVVIVRRTIAPYANKWALPGLRMYKNESIDDTLVRIANQETGLRIDTGSKRLLGQYVGRFKTENNRQDISTAYVVKALDDELRLNEEHFSGYRFIDSLASVPSDIGAMYRYYLERYFSGRS